MYTDDRFINDDLINGDLKNGAGYVDKTAYRAMKNVEEERRFRRMLGLIFSIVELSGFHLESRLVLKDKRTGKIYR